LQGTIKHVNNIVTDSFNDCVWALIGDFGNAATILRAKDNKKNRANIIWLTAISGPHGIPN